MANMTFTSTVQWTGEGVSADATSGGHTIRIDEPASLGGMDTGQNPVQLILSSLGGCLTVLINAFAPAHEVEIRDVSVEVEGDLDPDAFMGKSDARTGFSEIRYKINIDSSSEPEKVAALRDHAIRACPVKDTLTGVGVKEEEAVTA